ncbi:TAXI family TRAP transporter solute-binding subunit [Basilea psittacipulmonis]|uniref:C4-dicarboxylate ABC transporter substrate-binding protein n=1 Tax=Basilea psittacipulmonis DSM 24701 TaxID=1072685 RepID=A0A077DIT4_9BURK|nr:TAXI family TRAP transporter solute-binding subunit [Basilea psittacipulmonis]AIL33068.1 C4-dicarboxylate ABC transporter substrate-binding protein [Basilea psittacipulmonis DSM 24701]
MSKNYRKYAVLAVLAIFGLSACGDNKGPVEPTAVSAVSKTEAPKLDTKFVTIATGGASGPYNIIATSMAEIYRQTYQVNSKTQTTGASVENLNLIDQGKVEMAFVMSDALNDAVNGTGNFNKKIDKVSQIVALYPNVVQAVTSKGTGIKTIEDIKGKRVAVGALNSGAEVATRNLLNGFGITYDDIHPDFLGYAESADALRSGKVDVAFLISGLPNASLLELKQGFDLQLIEIPSDKVIDISKTIPYFSTTSIPINTYDNDEPVVTASIRNALVVRSDLSENDVYLLTKTFFDNLAVLENAHQAVKGIDVENADKNFVAPMHPGALKYYQSRSK